MPLTFPQAAASIPYTPVLKGASEDPTPVVYTTQVGSYILVRKLCFFTAKIVTSSITKSTLTDALRVSLPFLSANNANQIFTVDGRLQNGTPVQNGNMGYIGPNTQYVTVAQLGLTVARVDITYALLSLGVLTNVITLEFSGMYEIA